MKLILHRESGLCCVQQADHLTTFQGGSMGPNNARLYTLQHYRRLSNGFHLIVRGWHAPALPSSTSLTRSSTTTTEWKMKVESPSRLASELVGLLAEYEMLVISGIGLVTSVGLISSVGCRSEVEVEFGFGFEVVIEVVFEIVVEFSCCLSSRMRAPTSAVNDNYTFASQKQWQRS